jgi:hypothetical protein
VIALAFFWKKAILSGSLPFNAAKIAAQLTARIQLKCLILTTFLFLCNH